MILNLGAFLLVAGLLPFTLYLLINSLAAFIAEVASSVAQRRKVALRGSQAAKTATPASRRELETSSLEAYTHCGGCGKLDYHPMRDPICTEDDILTVIGPWAKAKVDSGEIALEWIGECIRKRWPLVPEVDFDVIRTCSSCSHEWGQK